MNKKIKTAPRSEAKGLCYLALSFLLAIALLTYTQDAPQKNWLGLAGYGSAWMLTYFFGLIAFPVLGFLGWIGFRMLACRPVEKSRIIYFSVFLLSIAILLNLFTELGAPVPQFLANKVYVESTTFEIPYPHRYDRYNLGGVPLYYLYRDCSSLNLQVLLSDIGIAITFSITAIVSFGLLANVRFLSFFESFVAKVQSLKDQAFEETKDFEEEEDKAEITLLPPRPLYTPPPMIKEKVIALKESIAAAIEQRSEQKTRLSKKESAIQAQRVANGDFTTYELPPLSLLNQPKKIDQPLLKKDLRRQAEILEETLMSFGIEAKVGEINCGPTITSFEVHPAVGVKVQKIKALENDIALNLQAKSIRIIAPIPGKAAVGVEIPSLHPQEVSFKECS